MTTPEKLDLELERGINQSNFDVVKSCDTFEEAVETLSASETIPPGSLILQHDSFAKEINIENIHPIIEDFIVKQQYQSLNPDMIIKNNMIHGDKVLSFVTDLVLEVDEKHDLSRLEYEINKGEGAFYGPKIEFVLRDAIGRDWQCGTLQVDLNLPGRLGATFVDKDGSKKVPVMLHRALFGSLERFIGILIEHYAGKLPFWITSLQAMVIPVSNEFDTYAKEINKKIRNAGISCEVDLKNHNLNYKIREHSLSKVPLLLICGKKEVDSNTVTIRRLDTNKQETMELKTFLQKFSALNKAPLN